MAKRKKMKKSNKSWILIAVVAVIIILFVLMLSNIQPKNIEASNQGQSQQTTIISGAGDTCKRDSECLLASCKSTPNVIECVNALHSELYYKECGNDWKNVVPAVKNVTRCSCVQGVCTAK